MTKANSETKPPIQSDNSSNGDASQTGAQAEESAKATSAGLASIANTLADAMPAVQEHAILESQRQADEVKARYADLRDTDGNAFDPKIHKVGADGEPTLSAKNKLVKRPGRKAGADATAPKSFIGAPGASSPLSTGPSQEATSQMQARAAGNMAANLLMQLGLIAGGDEWQPRKDISTGLDEKIMLESAFGDYFLAKGIIDIPPGMVLTVAIGGYMLPRFTMPKTRTRLERATMWAKKKWADRKLRKHGLKSVEQEKADE